MNSNYHLTWQTATGVKFIKFGYGLRNMQILVTGGAGFIGSHLVDLLSKDAGSRITILDNFYRGGIDNIKHHLKNKNITLVDGDIRNFKTFKNIGKFDVVYHLAVQSN